MRVIRILSIALVTVLLLASIPSRAGLPVDVNGTKLPSLSPVLKKSSPAVVNIFTRSTVQIQQNPLVNDPFFQKFFNLKPKKRKRQSQNLGSGVIVDAERGYIITNNHVIDKADIISVTLKDGRKLDAKLVGTDPDTDIAVLKVEAKGLTALPMANSEKLEVGDFVIAIGNPFGLGQTVTSGIISALGRSGLGIGRYEDYIQTDASINPGNSGGALIDLRGRLIGINNAIYSRSGGNIGIGFAIPMNMARDVMNQLIENGKVERGRLGAQAQDLTPDLAQAFELNPKIKGAVVVNVNPGSPAANAGLRVGDVVRILNGRKVESADDLRTAIGLLRVGTVVTLTVLRDSREYIIRARIAKTRRTHLDVGKLHHRLQGAIFSNLSEDHSAYGKIEGVVVSKVKRGSPAAKIGLREGDIITKINKRVVQSPNETKKLLANGKRRLLLNLVRGRSSMQIYLQ